MTDSLIVLYCIVVIIIAQGLLAYGTAYRFTKRYGDNGVASFGWMFFFGLAALVPGLGYYFWHKSKQSQFLSKYARGIGRKSNLVSRL